MRIRGPRVPINLLTNGGRKYLNLTAGLRRYGFIKNLFSFLCKPNPVECLSAANDRSRRYFAVAARSGEGPFTILIADLRHCVVQTGGLLSSRPTPW